MDIQKIGVIGAGQMGNGIAHVMALAGYNVVLNDINQQALDAAVSAIQKNLTRQASKGKIDQTEVEATLGRISTSLTLADIGKTDLVIEAATEREIGRAHV